MMYKIVTETGKVIKSNLEEKQANKIWEMLNGIWICINRRICVPLN